MPTASPLILTLHLDDHSAAYFNALRGEHFPAAINYLSAHLTLFHHLPSHELPALVEQLEAQCQELVPIPVKVTGLRFLGRGVAYKLESEKLSSLRRRLAKEWNSFLKPQDLQPFQPHITVQNKVEPPQARQLFESLTGSFQAREITGTGIDLWS